MELRQGEITGVVGENASGKSTLFRIIAGELRHDKGFLKFPLLQGDRTNRLNWFAIKQELAYVPQELPSWHVSLEDNIRYEAAVHGVKADDNDREVAYIIQRLGLEEHLGKRWNELSGGLKLRFSLATALVWKPKLLLIDEPLANLDFKKQLLILRDLHDMANSLRYPMAVLISSQHLHAVEAVADNILFLRAGGIAFNGPISALGDAREHNTFEVGCPLSQRELQTTLEGLTKSIYFNGLSFVITTPVDVNERRLLERLLETETEIEYFRNISRSIKQLFSETD
jgi:ABC-2 type transport system ATP-binding protein